MAVLTDFDTALGSALKGYAAGTALYSTRVYSQLAPQGATLPYVVYDYAAGGDTNESPSRIVDVEYRVEAVGTTQAQARTIAGHIEDALHNGTLTASGWNHIATTHIRPLSLQETTDGVQYWRRGGIYRIRMSK